jgi:hypothetical protein
MVTLYPPEGRNTTHNPYEHMYLRAYSPSSMAVHGRQLLGAM